MQQTGKTNLRAVAHLAGVSEMTVTRALANHKYVSAATREKVLAAAKELDYRPNLLARGLRSGATKSVGILANGNRQISREVSTKLMRQGFASYVIECAFNPQAIANAFREFNERRVDAVIAGFFDLAPFRDNQPLYEKQKNLIVTYNTPIQLPFKADSFFYDDSEAYRKIFRSILKKGCKHLYYIGRPEYPSTHTWLKIAAEFGIDSKKYFINASPAPEDESYQKYASLIRTLLRQAPEQPDAIFTHEDIPAARIAKTIQEEGFSIPDDIQVVAYTNTVWCELFTPSLTTVGYDISTCADRIFSLVMNRIEHPDSPERHEQYQSSAFFRESTGAE
ncbi:MAG: LacI family DNA-binding transcriptional regulator [Victivallaceae bacterium]|nr:LacI family DNA-binding transcriptional regulator [Victivallaceae bacterium]